LADQFVEALREKFFSDVTDASFARLSRLHALVQLFLQIDDVHLGGWLRRHVSDPQRAVFGVFSRGQDCIQKVLVALFFLVAHLFLFSQSSRVFSLGLGFAALICDRGGYQGGVVVLYERVWSLCRHLSAFLSQFSQFFFSSEMFSKESVCL